MTARSERPLSARFRAGFSPLVCRDMPALCAALEQDVGVGVAGGRLPEVLAGRSTFAAEIRTFLGAVLVHTSVPPQLWREVLVLAQLELATESLERADPNGMHLLSRAVRLSKALTRTR